MLRPKHRTLLATIGVVGGAALATGTVASAATTPAPTTPANASSIWIQTTDSSGQALGGASYELMGPSGAVEIATPAGTSTTTAKGCATATTGCVDMSVNLPAGTYNLREVGTPAPSTASPGGYAPCNGTDCEDQYAQIVVLSTGAVQAQVFNTASGDKTSDSNSYAGTTASPVVFKDSALGATGCASDASGVDGANVGGCVLPAGTKTTSTGTCGAYEWSCSVYDANERFIGNLYLSDLGRPAQASDIAYWDGQMASGVSAGQIAKDILVSTEDASSLVNSDYQSMLGRGSDAAGNAFWTHMIQTGTSNEIVLASLAASNEYFADHGSTDSGYVMALYSSILDAPVTATEPGVTYWVGQLEAGASRGTVATDLLGSNQYHGEQINSWYSNDLGRSADDASVAYWTSAFDHGATDATVEASILGSAEHIAYVWNGDVNNPSNTAF